MSEKSKIDEKRSAERRLTRREVLKAGLAGAAYLTLGSRFSRLTAKAAAAAPELPIEDSAVLNVLRWSAFVQGDQVKWEENTRTFEQETGVRVNLEWQGWEDVRPKAAMTANLGAGPDIIIGFFDDPHLYPQRLVDLSDIAEHLGSKYGGWYEAAQIYSKRDGRWIGLPMGAPGQAMVYRQSDLEKAGWDAFPETTDDLIRLAKDIKAKGGRPTGFPLGHAVGDGNGVAYWWLRAYGAKPVESDNKTVAINSPETEEALEKLRELHDTMIDGVTSWNDSHNNKIFLADGLSMTNNGISIYYAAKEQFPEIAEDIRHARMPIGPVGHSTALSLYSQAMVFNHSAYPNAAKAYLLYMWEAEQYGPWIENMRGYVTHALRDFSSLGVWTVDPKHTVYRHCMEDLLPNPWPGTPGAASAAAMSDYVLVDMCAEVVSGQRSVKDAITRAERRLSRLYNRRG